MNTDLRKKTKNDFEKDFLKLMNNAIFGKTMEIVRKHRDTNFVTTERGRNYLVSEPNYYNTKFFTESPLATKIKIKKNADTYEQTCLFTNFNTRIKQNVNFYVLV